MTYGWETGSEFSQGKRTYAVAEERRWSARRRHRQSSASSAVWLGKPMSHTQRPPHTSARSQYGSPDQAMSTPPRKSNTSIFNWTIFCNRDYIISNMQLETHSQLSRARIFIDFVFDISRWAHYMEAPCTTPPPQSHPPKLQELLSGWRRDERKKLTVSLFPRP